MAISYKKRENIHQVQAVIESKSNRDNLILQNGSEAKVCYK